MVIFAFVKLAGKVVIIVDLSKSLFKIKFLGPGTFQDAEACLVRLTLIAVCVILALLDTLGFGGKIEESNYRLKS